MAPEMDHGWLPRKTLSPSDQNNRRVILLLSFNAPTVLQIVFNVSDSYMHQADSKLAQMSRAAGKD